MSLSPAFRSPFTDLTGCLHNFQGHPQCARFEMNMIDCLEAYGLHMGSKKCKDLIDDFQECASRNKQVQRVQAMRMERHRQYYFGDRKEHFAEPPKEDAY
ncbi:NADH dehydrogenase [ubiquinone] iron-sulfur protein 5 [Pseudolycoriella hygida]|uniref:NADH dehydrogenase [ubiquinone] iron-sulfur protein 5 n=1 Tax=Pseudolycoriella hygida TaxID=35572 RepID=A0A9Q0NCZ8_9DIPT|nr:NADH dehydrogenase [ubiquinone] iron-sulfur protein 5 [Pseudolycoriella hygida]